MLGLMLWLFFTFKVTQTCLTLCDPVDYTVHGILQAGILQWVVFSFSRGSSQPKDQTQVSCIAGRFFTICATREAPTAIHESVKEKEEHHTLARWHPHLLLLGPFLCQIFSKVTCFDKRIMNLVISEKPRKPVGGGWHPCGSSPSPHSSGNRTRLIFFQEGPFHRIIFPVRWLQQLPLSLFFQRQDMIPPEQAGLLYQDEKVATHHLLLYVLQALPQVLALRPNLATEQHLHGKVLTHKYRGVFLGERKLFSFGKPMTAELMPPKPRTAWEDPVS